MSDLLINIKFLINFLRLLLLEPKIDYDSIKFISLSLNNSNTYFYSLKIS